MTRREWFASALSGAAAAWSLSRTTAFAEGRAMRDAVDHLLLGAPDLDHGIAWVEERTGVKAQMGGSHPGVGTRNALLSLGDRQYLEIIAPDPAQSAFNFQIDLRKLAEPRLVTWAASTTNLDEVVSRARTAGFQVFGPRDGSRVRPDGVTLKWRSAGVLAGLAEAAIDPVPFFIQWAPDSVHPSTDAPRGCRLVSLEAAHQTPSKLQDALAQLGIATTVRGDRHTALSATFETPRGRVVIS
jgi:glyoxalase-like protein